MAPIRRSRRLEHREEADSAAASAAEATATPATPPPAKKKKLAAGASAAAATRTKRSATTTTPTTPTVTHTNVDANDTTTTTTDTPAKAKRMSTRKKKSPTNAVAITTTKKTTTPKKAKVTGTAKTNAKGKARVTTTSTKTTTNAESESREGSGGMDTDVVMKTEDGTGVGESTAAVAGGDNNTPDAKPKSKVKSKSKNKRKTKADDATAAAPAREENEVKPKSKRGRKPKSDAGTRVADATAVTESAAITTTTTKKPRKTKVNDKGKDVKKEDEKDGSVNPPTTGSVGRKKRKVDPNVDGGGAGSGVAGTSSAQPGHASKKQRTSTLAPVPTTTINKSDPYSVLPTELWQEVVSYLSLSQITKVSSVSKGWLEGFRALQVWRDACVKGALGKPAKKYPTHMGLVCANSYWICEMCLAMIAGRGSDIPMPVDVAELGSESRMMCRECRCRYYKKHPEKIKIRKHIVNIYGEFEYERTTRFTKTDACGAYCLRDEDLLGLRCDERPNPHYRNAPPMRLYEEKDVIKMALKVHGGYIGLQAARKSTAKTRREAFKKRSEQAQTRVILKTAKKDQLHDEQLQALLQELSQDPKAFAQSVEFYVDKNAHTWFKAISGDSSRAKIKEAIAEAEARAAAGEHTLLIKSTTPDRKWIDNIRNSLNGNIIKREGLKKIIENFEAGVYDTKDNASTAATVASGSGSGSGSGSASGSTEPAGEAGGSPSSTQTTTTAMIVVVAQQQQ